MKEMTIYQDGSDFYNDSTGDIVFISSIVVRDGDFEAAERARQEFIACAQRIGLNYSFWNNNE